MSLKWQRSRRWDDEHIPGWAWPVKAVLRAFSSITLAVVLLSFVALYAVLASVPVGLLALAPTWGIYGLTLLAFVGAGAAMPVAVLWRASRDRIAFPARFAAAVVLFVGLAAATGWAWAHLLWPVLHYEPATGRGLRLFASFCDRYKSTTLRRLPFMEMSELEFYSWWPLRAVLLAFVANMVTATVRRIEFVFVNLGVLTVHTGIITITLGSVYYASLKLEGDVLLLAGEPGPDGTPTPGPAVDTFYDHARAALWVSQRGLWEQRPLSGIPRYNDYGLDAGPSPTARGVVGGERPASLPPLDLAVPPAASSGQNRPHRVDADVRFRVVGYASAAEAVRDWARADPPPSGPATPVRFVDLRVRFPRDASPRSVFRFFLLPTRPAERTAPTAGFTLEYTRGMSDGRWAELTSPLPGGAAHALVIDVPSATYRAVHAAEPGATIDAAGWRIEVQDVLPQPPLPIITEGYRGATSSVAVVRVTPPSGPAFTRYVYHRFPEISQDLLDAVNDRGMPTRRDADPAIRIGYIDASLVQVYLDEREDGLVRAAVRLPAGRVLVTERLEPGSALEEFVPRRDPDRDPKIDLVLGERWEHAEPVERPRPLAERERRSEDVGTHARAMLAVEVSVDARGPRIQAAPWSRVVWLPFTKYLGVGLDTERRVTLPDGRELSLAFGRAAHRFGRGHNARPDFMIQLVDFRAITYEHRGAPRDYQSTIRVIPAALSFEPYVHVTSLNAPLQAPFLWDDERRSWLANVAGTLASRLDPGQFKLSQAGWDQQGWERTQSAADRGELARPFASFTILGVGNNPGIHVIALGGVLMSVGIPWAFYVKPWILRRRARRLRERVARAPAGAPAAVDPVAAGLS